MPKKKSAPLAPGQKTLFEYLYQSQQEIAQVEHEPVVIGKRGRKSKDKSAKKNYANSYDLSSIYNLINTDETSNLDDIAKTQTYTDKVNSAIAQEKDKILCHIPCVINVQNGISYCSLVKMNSISIDKLIIKFAKKANKGIHRSTIHKYVLEFLNEIFIKPPARNLSDMSTRELCKRIKNQKNLESAIVKFILGKHRIRNG